MHRPTWVEIDLSALKHNIEAIKKWVGTQVNIIGVVKADAYGHGDYEVCKVLQNHGVETLGIAILEEGIHLRTKGILTPLLLLGGIFEDQIDAIIRYNLMPTVYDLKLAGAISQRAHYFSRNMKVHVYVDTGMGSIGVKHNKAVEFVKALKTMQNIIVDGIFTHCSSSDEKDPSYTNLQIKRFKDVLAGLEEIKLHIPFRHMANSGAIIGHPDAHLNTVRPGLSLYGMYPAEEVSRNIRIRPVMSFKTKIVHIKDMEAGDVVGYGRTCRITKPSRIATLPLGYDDGYNRLLSNQGKVIIRGIKAPIVGRVCMDQCFVDVSIIRDASVGDEVALYGSQGRETITVESVAKQLNTIPYEITCNISKRVPRIYVNGK